LPVDDFTAGRNLPGGIVKLPIQVAVAHDIFLLVVIDGIIGADIKRSICYYFGTLYGGKCISIPGNAGIVVEDVQPEPQVQYQILILDFVLNISGIIPGLIRRGVPVNPGCEIGDILIAHFLGTRIVVSPVFNT
jgi:hypothetical protein